MIEEIIAATMSSVYMNIFMFRRIVIYSGICVRESSTRSVMVMSESGKWQHHVQRNMESTCGSIKQPATKDLGHIEPIAC